MIKISNDACLREKQLQIVHDHREKHGAVKCAKRNQRKRAKKALTKANDHRTLFASAKMNEHRTLFRGGGKYEQTDH